MRKSHWHASFFFPAQKITIVIVMAMAGRGSLALRAGSLRMGLVGRDGLGRSWWYQQRALCSQKASEEGEDDSAATGEHTNAWKLGARHWILGFVGGATGGFVIFGAGVLGCLGAARLVGAQRLAWPGSISTPCLLFG